jgi:hypothetical protein
LEYLSGTLYVLGKAQVTLTFIKWRRGGGEEKGSDRKLEKVVGSCIIRKFIFNVIALISPSCK